MSVGAGPLRQAQIVTGALFSEPMRVETVRPAGADAWVLHKLRGLAAKKLNLHKNGAPSRGKP